MTQSIIFHYETRISSCRPGHTELQQGEEVILELKEKNPSWPDNIRAIVGLVQSIGTGRKYTFEYDDEVLNGAVVPEACDISEIRCFSCCDDIRDNLTLPTDRIDGLSEFVSNLISIAKDGKSLTTNDIGGLEQFVRDLATMIVEDNAPVEDDSPVTVRACDVEGLRQFILDLVNGNNSLTTNDIGGLEQFVTSIAQMLIDNIEVNEGVTSVFINEDGTVNTDRFCEEAFKCLAIDDLTQYADGEPRPEWFEALINGSQIIRTADQFLLDDGNRRACLNLVDSNTNENGGGREQLAISYGCDSHGMGSRGAAAKIYGNEDASHGTQNGEICPPVGGPFVISAGPDDNANAVAFFTADYKIATHGGGGGWDTHDTNGGYPGQLNIMNPVSTPGLYIQSASASEGDIAVREGEILQMGHWSDSKPSNPLNVTELNFLVISQSNLGQDDGVNNPTGINNPNPNPRLRIMDRNTSSFRQWTNNSQILSADNNVNTFDRSVSWNINTSTWAWHLGQELLSIYPNATISFTVVARTGTRINELLVDRGDGVQGFMYEHLVEEINLAQAQGVSTFDGILFSQGETDSLAISNGTQTIAEFSDQFEELSTFLSSIGATNSSTPWIIQKQPNVTNRNFINPYWDSLDGDGVHFALENQNLAVHDGLHFDYASLSTIGTLAFSAFQEANGQKGSFTTRFQFDTIGNWIGNRGIYMNPQMDNVTANSQSGFEGLSYVYSGALSVTSADQTVIFANRLGTDGAVAAFQKDGVTRGGISIAGDVVTYNTFTGAHISQLYRTDTPLEGTIMQAVDVLCEWENRSNNYLPKVKSASAKSKSVYGVYSGESDLFDSEGDICVVSLGTNKIRVSGEVSMGDLIVSGDNGVGVVNNSANQSEVVAKIIGTKEIITYDDGSKLFPATIHCG